MMVFANYAQWVRSFFAPWITIRSTLAHSLPSDSQDATPSFLFSALQSLTQGWQFQCDFLHDLSYCPTRTLDQYPSCTFQANHQRYVVWVAVLIMQPVSVSFVQQGIYGSNTSLPLSDNIWLNGLSAFLHPGSGSGEAGVPEFDGGVCSGGAELMALISRTAHEQHCIAHPMGICRVATQTQLHKGWADSSTVFLG